MTFSRLSRHTAARRTTTGPQRAIVSAVVAVALAYAPLGVHADLRTIPPAAKRGEMEPPQNGVTRIGKQWVRISVGAQIRDQANRIITPIAVQRPVLVRYQLDSHGELWRAWILTPEEAARPDR